MTTDTRNAHPYHMYEAILAQPEAFARVIERNREAVEEFASRTASCGRIFLAGIGTSHHATLVGEHLMRAYGGGPDVRAVHSFDLALYGPEIRPDDCLVAVSHRGAKRYTALALDEAREKGCPTALITGDAGGGEGRAATVFRTVAQEKSSAHTVSYTAAVAVLASLAGRLGYHRGGQAALPNGLLTEKVPGVLRAALETEEQVEALAREHVGRRRIWLLGGGPGGVTAVETALKIKETSYLQAEGMPTETMLHGPFQCVEADDLFVLIAPSGVSRDRTLEVAELVEEVGASYVVVGDETTESLSGAAGVVRVPEVSEPFSALACLVPLQLFTYHLALARGTNPDTFRVDDPRFARADVSARL
ncbi:MAG TPA: SIS domain-containing protein [Rubrobacter sp.]|nr:SIS domain-containing protein [Rubrobacter sp.]